MGRLQLPCHCFQHWLGGSMRKFLAASLSAMLVVSTLPTPTFAESHRDRDDEPQTATPIKHVVVIFGENISFDHYFGTYPKAENNSGETRFHYTPSTHRGNDVANTLSPPLDPTKNFSPLKGVNLLTNNPNGPT